MKFSSLNVLACPTCRGGLAYSENPNSIILSGELICKPCSRTFHIQNGIPAFIQKAELSDQNLHLSRLYDSFSWAYSAFSTLALAAIGLKENEARRLIADRLDPHGGRLLEVSIGTGTNLPYLATRQDVGEIFGLDISTGQLNRCLKFARKNAWQVELFLGNAEVLPFQDNTFSSLLHIGGINFFNDKQAAIQEMIRVVTPGAKVLIADETEKGAAWYDRFIPGFLKSFKGRREPVKPPFYLLPKDVLDKQLTYIWKDWFYCIEFRKAI